MGISNLTEEKKNSKAFKMWLKRRDAEMAKLVTNDVAILRQASWASPVKLNERPKIDDRSEYDQ